MNTGAPESPGSRLSIGVALFISPGIKTQVQLKYKTSTLYSVDVVATLSAGRPMGEVGSLVSVRRVGMLGAQRLLLLLLPPLQLSSSASLRWWLPCHVATPALRSASSFCSIRLLTLAS